MKLFTVLVFCLLSSNSFSENYDPNLDIDGIWKTDIFVTGSYYYSIHTNPNTNQIVFIELSSISHGAEFESTFIGTKGIPTLRKITLNSEYEYDLYLSLTSSTEGTITYRGCATCNMAIIPIEKIF